MNGVLQTLLIRCKAIVCCTMLCVSPLAIAATTSTVNVKPGDDLSAIVYASPANTTFLFAPGVYRMQTLSPKNGDVFSGGTGSVVLNGSQVLTFVADTTTSGLWVADATADTTFTGECQTTAPLCGYNQDLFVDSVLQTPQSAPTGLTAGSWYFDRAHGKVYLPIDPTSHTVEIAMTPFAFTGTASNVEIDHITVEKYATPALQGAIGGDYWVLGSYWVLNDVESRLNHGAGVVLGTQSQVLNSYIHNNGQEGLKFYSCVNCVASGNEISWNNSDGFSNQYESGGTKFWATTNLIIKSNYVHDNNGIGLWTDTNNVNALFDSNTVTNNADAGIQHEVSYAAVIRNNIVKGNAAVPSAWVGNSQIRLFSSSNTQVYGNTVEVSAAGGSGISIINMTRGSGVQGPWVAANNSVHNNTVTYLGTTGESGLENDTPGNTAGVNNQFDYNTYVMADCSPNRWVWQSNIPITWQQLLALGQEAHGSYSVVPLVDNALSPVPVLSAQSYTFPNTTIGATQTYKTFTITNTGKSPLVVCSITPTGSGASSFIVPAYKQLCGTVAVNASCTFAVGFNPAAVGNYSASLTITSYSPSSPQSISLSGTGVPPPPAVVSLSPTSFAFPKTTIGTTSVYQKFTLQDTGKGGLRVNSVTITGTNASSFAIPTGYQNCQAVAPGASCTFYVAFTPKTVGNYSAQIVVTDTAGNSPQTITITGTGAPLPTPAVSLSPTSFAFPNTIVGSTSAYQKFTLQDTGTGGLRVNSVSITGTNASAFIIPTGYQNCQAVAAGSSCTFDVAFVPKTVGNFTAQIVVSDTAGNSPQTISLTGTAVPLTSPVVSLSPTSFAFPKTFVGSTSTYQKFTLQDTGTGGLRVTSVTISGANASSFVIPTGYQNCQAVAAGSSCTFDVAFTPKTVGSFTATILVADTAGNSPQMIAITGTGTALPAPVVSLSPTSFTFPKTTEGMTSVYQKFTVQDTGNAGLRVTSVTISGANASSFVIPTGYQNCQAVAAGSSCTFDVAFTPKTVGSFTATVLVADTASNSPQSIAISGTSAPLPAPVVSLSPTSYAFPKTTEGMTSVYQKFTLKNTGNAGLRVTSVTISGTNASSFIIPTGYQNCQAVAAGSSCTFDVAFTPKAVGNFTATVLVADTAGNSPQSIAITGTGIAPPAPIVSISPTSFAFASTLVGTTSPYQLFTVKNTGDGSLGISSIAVSGTDASSFIVPTDHQNCKVVAAGSSCTFDVAFTPKAAGALTASIVVKDNASTSPQSISVSGTGRTK